MHGAQAHREETAGLLMNERAVTRMHTAEHILTAVMRRLFGSPRKGEAHLGEKKSKCDYTVPRALTDDDIVAIEDAVNGEIMRNDKVSYEVLPIDAARERYDLWKVPSGADAIRIVHIGDFDVTPCSGEHVEHTAQVGKFHIKSYHMKDEETVRIRFSI